MPAPAQIIHVFIAKPIRCAPPTAVLGSAGTTTVNTSTQNRATPIGLRDSAADTSPAQNAATALVLPQKGQG